MHGKGVVQHIAFTRRFRGIFQSLHEPAKLLSLIAVVSAKVLPAAGFFDLMGKTMGGTKPNRLGKQIMGAFAVFPAQLECGNPGGITQKGKIDELIHCLEIKPGLLGVSIEVQIFGFHLWDRLINPHLGPGKLQLRVTHRIKVLIEGFLVPL